MKYQRYWEQLRIDWINGYHAETIANFLHLTKHQMCHAIYEALKCHYESLPSGTTHSGDLTDLMEILKHIE